MKDCAIGSSPVRFSIPVRVYYEDTDAAGVVYYANYLKFFERCRTEWVRSLGHDQSAMMHEHDIAFVVRHASANYRKPARLDDLLTVDLCITGRGRSRLILEQRILHASEATPLVSGQIEIACIRASTFKPVSIPPFLNTQFDQSA